MGDDERGFVTVGEFTRYTRLLEEIRTDIKDDVAGVRQDVLDTRHEITSRQDIANGRTMKNEASVIAAHDQIAALIGQVTGVQTTVSAIKSGGCDQKGRHVELLDALSAAGVVPDTNEILDRPERPAWTRREKALAVSAGAGIGGLGLSALAPHVGQMLHALAHFFAWITGTPLP